MKLALSAFCALLAALASSGSILTAKELNGLRGKPYGTQDDFRISGLVIADAALCDGDFILADDSGRVRITPGEAHSVTAGAQVVVQGNARIDQYGKLRACAHSIEVIGSASIPPPAESSIPDLHTGNADLRIVRFNATLIDAFRDDVDAARTIAVLMSDGETITASTLDDGNVADRLAALNGATLSIVGLCDPTGGRSRRFHGHYVFFRPENITVLTPPPSDPFNAGLLGDLHHVNPEDFIGLRRKSALIGTVHAIWQPRNLLLATDSAQKSIVTVANGQPLPRLGQRIRAVGFPETDLFSINLTTAIWREEPGSPTPMEPPCDVTIRDVIRTDSDGSRTYNTRFNGALLRLTGRIISVPSPESKETHIVVDSDGTPIQIDISSCPDAIQMLAPNCLVEIIGICLMDTEKWSPLLPFPRIRGIRIIARASKDFRIITRPPWWTPLRLMVVIGVLLAVILAIGIWNRALKVLSERRGRELMAEQLNRASADLKVGERTRLAVELHDALSQNLTGVSLQLDAVKRFADEDRGKMARHLDLAMRTLKSCRDELRNCLWDLRNRALEEKDMNEAIRRTASPFVGDAALLIRFNVPRDQISDNTAHALMRIVRELATNAVRHGGAKTIRIAGALENGRLLFSVSDDGRGFDPANHPGVDEGHFGLDGIRDRVSRFDGALEIESAPDRGATIRISMTA